VHLSAGLRDDVASLYELPAEHRFAVDLTVGGGPVGELQEANVFLDGEDLERRRIEAGGEQDLDELLGQALGAGAVADAVEHDHTAVSAERIAGEGALVGGLDGFAEGAAAWVVVLDDRAG